MRPIGLTLKPGRNKYRPDAGGELMLVHECTECKALSINRIAADDEPVTVMAVFEGSLALGHPIRALCQQQGIVVLKAEQAKIVHTQLYGHSAEMPAIPWR
jgi:hypothetical protein